MPVITVKIVGHLTKKQKNKIAEEITKTLKLVADKDEQYTYVIFEEVEAENWAWKGKLLSDN